MYQSADLPLRKERRRSKCRSDGISTVRRMCSESDLTMLTTNMFEPNVPSFITDDKLTRLTHSVDQCFAGGEAVRFRTGSSRCLEGVMPIDSIPVHGFSEREKC